MKHFTQKQSYIFFVFLLAFSAPSIITKQNALVKKQTNETQKKPSNPHPGKFVKEMNEQELTDMLAYAKATNNKELVFKVFHFLMTVSTDQEALKNYKLDLADYCYKLEDFEKAAFMYEEFSILFPGSTEMEYASYKSILCWFYLSLSPERDQTFTHKTILLIDMFLDKAKNTTYIDEVKDIRKTCRQKLFEHEAHIFEHYSKQKKFSGAEKRLDYIKENFQDIQHIERYITYFEKFLMIAKDPHRPFLLTFNLQEAITHDKSQKKESTSNKKKSALFFLS